MYPKTQPLMIAIICAKYRNNPSRTVGATEGTRFSKSRSNDLEDIGQGQGSSHATHLLILVIICTKYGNNPSGTVDATGRTRKVNRQTDRHTDRQTDRVNPIYTTPPLTSLRGGYKNASENVVWKTAAILSRPQYVKTLQNIYNKVHPLWLPSGARWIINRWLVLYYNDVT